MGAPPIRREDRLIEFLVRQFQPGGAGVVEIRQRALFLFGGGDSDVRRDCHLWMQSSISLLDEFFRRLRNRLNAGIIHRLFDGV